MSIKKIVTVFKKPFRNLYFLMFLNGFLLASIFYFKMESTYENGLFLSIKNTINRQLDANDTQDSIVIKAMKECNYLMTDRASTFQYGAAPLGPQADFFHSTAVDLMTTRGACGSYSQVLARILQTYQFPIRIAQMKADGVFAAHNIVEVKTGKDWVVLDPTFNAHFVRPDGKLASFADVKGDWSYYSKQVPPGYDLKYRYEDVRYSNWGKLPFLSPLVKGLFKLFLGSEKIETFSLRTYFLKVYELYFYFTILIYIPVFLFTISQFVKTKLFPARDIPFTFTNLIKYLKPLFGEIIPGKRVQSF
ncbi:hypothetical protein ACX0G9_10340 [Flavitalea flava]